MPENEIRDQLATLIDMHSSYRLGEDSHDIADAVLRAGWRPPVRIITDAADLDALPIGTVVMNDGGQIAQRYDGPGVWWQVLDNDQYDSADLIGTGHVTVLHEPDEAQR